MAHFCAAATAPPGRSAWCIIPPPLTLLAPFVIVTLIMAASMLTLPWQCPAAIHPFPGVQAIALLAQGTKGPNQVAALIIEGAGDHPGGIVTHAVEAGGGGTGRIGPRLALPRQDVA